MYIGATKKCQSKYLTSDAVTDNIGANKKYIITNNTNYNII